MAPSTCSTAACTEVAKTVATPKSHKSLKRDDWEETHCRSQQLKTGFFVHHCCPRLSERCSSHVQCRLWKAETSPNTKHIVCTTQCSVTAALLLLLCYRCFSRPAFAQESAERLGAVAKAGGVFVPLDTGRAPTLRKNKNPLPWCPSRGM